MSVSACMPSAPKSSHMVPNSCTPIVFCSTLSSIENNASDTDSKAFRPVSPPSVKAFFISPTDNPRDCSASSPVPSFILIPNSFTASPSLSTLNVPLAAPLSSELNIPSASIPICLKCTEYSFILSSKSPFLSSPSCAPCVIRLNASLPDIPNWSISILTALTLSCMSYPNVSRNIRAFDVISLIADESSFLALCATVEIAPAMSSKLSP